MSKISDAFSHGKAFVGFITAGDPTLDTTKEIILKMAQAGGRWKKIARLRNRTHWSASLPRRRDAVVTAAICRKSNILYRVLGRQGRHGPFVFLPAPRPLCRQMMDCRLWGRQDSSLSATRLNRRLRLSASRCRLLAHTSKSLVRAGSCPTA